MAEYETLELQVEAGIARLMLNRPKALNAIDQRMAEELLHAIGAIEANADVSAVVLHGAGGNFCAGGDVRGMQAAGPRSVTTAHRKMARYRKLTAALYHLNRPVIAAVDGVAFGAGFSLALLADIVVLGDRARLSMVFARVGLIPDCGALYTLPRIVGLQRAKELVFSAREIGAAEALQLGLALEVLPSEGLMPRALAIAASLRSASALTMSLAKQALNRASESDLSTLLDIEAAGQALAMNSDYHNEAVRRFIANEPPLLGAGVATAT